LLNGASPQTPTDEFCISRTSQLFLLPFLRGAFIPPHTDLNGYFFLFSTSPPHGDLQRFFRCLRPFPLLRAGPGFLGLSTNRRPLSNARPPSSLLGNPLLLFFFSRSRFSRSCRQGVFWMGDVRNSSFLALKVIPPLFAGQNRDLSPSPQVSLPHSSRRSLFCGIETLSRTRFLPEHLRKLLWFLFSYQVLTEKDVLLFHGTFFRLTEDSFSFCKLLKNFFSFPTDPGFLYGLRQVKAPFYSFFVSPGFYLSPFGRDDSSSSLFFENLVPFPFMSSSRKFPLLPS